MRYAYVMTAMLALAGCGGDDGGGEDEPQAVSGAALQARCETFSKATMERYWDCNVILNGTEVSAGDVMYLTPDLVDECVADPPSDFATVDEETFAETVDAMKTITCEDLCARVKGGCAEQL